MKKFTFNVHYDAVIEGVEVYAETQEEAEVMAKEKTMDMSVDTMFYTDACLTDDPKEAETYYQAEKYSDDGTNIEYNGIPCELASFHVFHSEDECREWLDENGYDPDDFVVKEYHDEDIEGHTYVNW